MYHKHDIITIIKMHSYSVSDFLKIIIILFHFNILQIVIMVISILNFLKYIFYICQQLCFNYKN